MINELIATTLTATELITTYTHDGPPPESVDTPFVPYLGFTPFLANLTNTTTTSDSTNHNDGIFTYTPGEDTLVIATLSPDIATWIATHPTQFDEATFEDAGIEDATSDDWDTFTTTCQQRQPDQHIHIITMS